MYRENEFYYITDKLHHDVYYFALKEHLKSEERLIVKIFKDKEEEIVIETIKGKDMYIKDTRRDKKKELYDYDLVFLKAMERYTSDYEIKGMVYEFVEGIGSWYRVEIPGFDPTDPDLAIFYKKKQKTEEEILASDVPKEVKKKQLTFLKITKGLPFSSPSKIKKMFCIK